MTKLNKLLLVCSACCCITATLPSCTSEVDDYFDQPASQRLAAAVSHAQQVLRSAEYGWEFEYYPGSDLAYGGMVYTVKFDSLTATVGCSLIPDSTSTSYYRLTNDNGPVLTFDTYNPLLHYFSTPNSDEYEAKGGEFEFVIDSIADDFISLYGKKTRNTMYLRKLTASPQEYARKTIDIFDNFVDSIRGVIGTAEISGKCSPATRSISMVNGTDTFDVHYTYTDRGIRLYRPLTIGGVSVQSFDFDTETKQFTCSDAGAQSVTLEGIDYPDNFMNYSRWEAEYTLNYGSKSVDVYLKPNRLEGTYIMQGLSPKYNLVLRYEDTTGHLKLGAQIVGQTSDNTIYWSCVNYTSSGSISNINIADEGQFTISWNGNRFYPRFNFAASSAQNYVNSAILIYLYYTESGSLSAGILTDSDWLTNGSYLFDNLSSLNRKSRL